MDEAVCACSGKQHTLCFDCNRVLCTECVSGEHGKRRFRDHKVLILEQSNPTSEFIKQLSEDYPISVASAALTTCHRILANLAENPTNPRYASVPMSAQRVVSDLIPVPDAIALLLALDFVVSHPSGHPTGPLSLTYRGRDARRISFVAADVARARDAVASRLSTASAAAAAALATSATAAYVRRHGMDPDRRADLTATFRAMWRSARRTATPAPSPVPTPGHGAAMDAAVALLPRPVADAVVAMATVSRIALCDAVAAQLLAIATDAATAAAGAAAPQLRGGCFGFAATDDPTAGARLPASTSAEQAATATLAAAVGLVVATADDDDSGARRILVLPTAADDVTSDPASPEPTHTPLSTPATDAPPPPTKAPVADPQHRATALAAVAAPADAAMAAAAAACGAEGFVAAAAAAAGRPAPAGTPPADGRPASHAVPLLVGTSVALVEAAAAAAAAGVAATRAALADGRARRVAADAAARAALVADAAADAAALASGGAAADEVRARRIAAAARAARAQDRRSFMRRGVAAADEASTYCELEWRMRGEPGGMAVPPHRRLRARLVADFESSFAALWPDDDADAPVDGPAAEALLAPLLAARDAELSRMRATERELGTSVAMTIPLGAHAAADMMDDG